MYLIRTPLVLRWLSHSHFVPIPNLNLAGKISLNEREKQRYIYIYSLCLHFIYQPYLETHNMPVEPTESDDYIGFTGSTYRNIDTSKGGDEIPTDPQDLTMFVQRVLEQMVRVAIVFRVVLIRLHTDICLSYK